ncbi:hypothetical protein [Amycolatopsis orientalis]|uniref:hypothetical protein n=1 Tax=Amycolatopsis orientalis TaxID=31958 RepID=UPI00055E86FB|nr:hypothetical protein [Amycolatopsis orientalis]
MSVRQRTEAVGKPASPGASLNVTWRSKQFIIPNPDNFPLEALEAEEEGKHLTALKLILGADQYATWRVLAATAADAEDFSAVVMKELGRGNP